VIKSDLRITVAGETLLGFSFVAGFLGSQLGAIIDHARFDHLPEAQHSEFSNHDFAKIDHYFACIIL
jgi:hypothetical protein